MMTVVSILWIILVWFLITKLFRNIGISSTVSLMILGLLFSIPFFKNIFFQWNTSNIVNILSNIGLISLMFVAWLGSSIKRMKKEENTSFWVSLLWLLFTWVLLSLVFFILGFPLSVSILVGICLSISAEWTTAQILLEEKKINSKVWIVMLESGIIDDIVGLWLFLVVSLFLRELHIQEYLLTMGSLLAFFAGSILKNYLWRHHNVVLKIEESLNIFIIPFFFISIGLFFDVNSIFVNWWILVVMIVLAIWGKLIWTQVAKPFVKDLSSHQLHLIGRAMNSRGAIWLAVAVIIFKIWIISVEVYSAIVITTLFTTIMFPFVMKRYLKKYPNIMR